MFSGKKRYLKAVQLLLVCCMIAGSIKVYPMVAEAAVTTDMFRKEAGGTKNDENITMTNQTDGSVLVQHSADADSELSNHTISTTGMYQLADGVHLEINNIQGRTGYENQYSFVLFMGVSWTHYYYQNLNYADDGIAMAFGHDGSYKIWTTASDNNPNPSKDAGYVLAYGRLSSKNAPENNNDSVELDIQREKAGRYYAVINGEKIEFQSDYDEEDVHLAFHVWAPLHTENYQFCYDNDTSKGTFSTGYGPQGSSYVISDIQEVDLDATEGKGFLDDYNNYITYKTEEPLSAFPLTFETEMYWTGTESGRNTTIAGTWDFGGERSYDVRMLSDGTLFLTVRKSTSQFEDIILYGAKAAENEWIHAAIVVEPEADETTGQYYVNTYINGVLKSTVGFGFNQKLNDARDAWVAGTPVDPTTLKPSLPLVIGANNVTADPMLEEGETPATTTLYGAYRGTCFDGRIKSVSLWNEARTADEVLADYTNGVTVSDQALLGYYELEEGKTTFADQSGKGNDIAARKSWFKDISDIGKTELVQGEDYEYSMIVVGDTQIINDYQNGTIDTENYDNSQLAAIYKWIAANKDVMNIKFVMGVGDITDHSNATEWANADHSFTNYLLDKDIRFASAIGNHDYSAGYNSMSYLKTDKYQNYIEGNYWKDVQGKDGYMEDSYQLLEVETSEGTLKYLLMTLGYGPDDNVLKWTGEVCEQYPDYNVIVATHAYLQYDGTTLDSVNDAYSTIPSEDGKVDVYPYEETRNDGEDIWNEFIRKHENITMVLSGHVSSQEVIWSSQTGDNGNKVTELLIDPQGIDASGDNGLLPTGMVSILYFDAEGSAVAHRNYSTIQEMYYSDLSQFDNLDINVIQPAEPSGVEISKSNLLMIPGETETLTATPVPAAASGTITWNSGNTEVAAVDEATGVVTAVAAGEAIITAAYGDHKAECKVWVRERTDYDEFQKVNTSGYAYASPIGVTSIEDISGYKITHASGATEAARFGYLRQIWTDSISVSANIDRIETVSENYSLAIWFGTSGQNGWLHKEGHALLIKENGQYVIINLQSESGDIAGQLNGASVVAQGDIGELHDSISLSIGTKDEAGLRAIRINDTECTITEGNSWVYFSVGAVGDFTVDSETHTITYGSGWSLDASLSYRVTMMGYTPTSMTVKDDYSSTFDYYRASGEAPIKGGFVFAGWYEDSGLTTPVAANVQAAETGKTYYAKFLPKDVLGVKAQLRLSDGVSTAAASGTTEMRLVTTIDDSLNYAEVGFIITSGSATQTYTRTTAYDSLNAAGVEMTPDMFHTCSKRFVTVNMGNLTWNNDTKPVDRPITVQVYWKTYDGTIVYGSVRTLTIQQGLDAIDATTRPYSL